MKKTAQRTNRAGTPDWSAMDAYLRDVSQYSNLSHEETLALGQLARDPKSSPEEVLAAREALVKSHLLLVVKLAHQYASFGMALADLIAEGNLGLLRAAELYDPKFGTWFTTYASVWIRQRIHRAITSQARVVRVPVWRSQRLRKLSRIQEELSAQLGRSASEEELSERLGISMEGLSELQSDRIEVVSMDASPNGAEDEWSIGETLADESAEQPGARMRAEELHDEMLACLADLEDRELQVLSLRFGLSVPAAVSFRELGRRMGVSHEWVRRIAELALVKVRRAFAGAHHWTARERQSRRESASARVLSIAAGMGVAIAAVNAAAGGAGLIAEPAK